MSVVPGCDWAALASFDHIEMRPGGREEVLDGVVEEFPYLAVLSQHDRYHERTVPWHWHQEVELFYVLSGTVLYATPHERLELGPGAAGFVNANVLHMTRAVDERPGVDLLIHEFRPRLIAEPRSLLWSRYVEPLTSTTSIELFATGPDDSATSACARCSTSWAPTTPSASACGTWRPLPLRASASATAPFARPLG